MRTEIEIIKDLEKKYSNPDNPQEFAQDHNNWINAFHRDQEKRNDFAKWLNKTSITLNIKTTFFESIFFPSFTFSCNYETKIYDQYTNYKYETVGISFLEDYYTSYFNCYMREKRDGKNITFKPIRDSIRDSEFEYKFKLVDNKVKKKFPNKLRLSKNVTDFIIGAYQMTYSGQPNTSVYELLFRSKV